jgi:myo-inositol-1(or 4)-monophosphatase
MVDVRAHDASTGPPDHPLLRVALAAAREAGALLLERADPWSRGPLSVRTKSSATDAVTELDVAAERLIVERLTRDRPHDAVLAEEGHDVAAPADAGPEAVRWVIDPLDGTVNYLYGLPHWAVSIAAQQDGATVIGVVHVPVLDETFVAVQGGGAWHVTREGARRLRLGEGVGLDQALVATGFSYAAHERAQQAEVLASLLPLVRDVRRLGAAAVDLAHAALGRVDVFFEAGLQPWDVAAGALIVEEAGGVVVVEPTPGSAAVAVIAGPVGTVRDLAARLGAAGAGRPAP